jgi:hypothetical protein
MSLDKEFNNHVEVFDMSLSNVGESSDQDFDVEFNEFGEAFNLDASDVQIVHVGGSADFEIDDTLKMDRGVLSVNTINEVVEDSHRPITSGAVYEEFSKAVALLKTI